MTRLPPLNALRAFEAAARYLSFTRAAEELHVTQAAVSHQIKSLEEFLGKKLFHRRNRELALTEKGLDYLPAVKQAFEILHEATRRVLSTDESNELTVSALPSFTSRWLIPRLGRFIDEHPDINILISPSRDLSTFGDDGVDVGIRYGKGKYPGLYSERLMTDDIFPVCSPTLMKGRKALRKPQDLRHHVLLHDDRHGDWQTWLLAAGVKGVDGTHGPIITDSGMLIEAAVEGHGVALARGVLAANELSEGRLVRPFELRLPADYAYYIVCPQGTAERPSIKIFRQWLLREATATQE